MKRLRETIMNLIHTRVKPASETAIHYFNARSTREKVMLIAAAAVFVIFLDYWILIRPIVQVFSETLPKLSSLEAQWQEETNDKKNKDLIEKQWSQAREMLNEKEKMFIAPSELPALLENLSQMAQDSGIKILSLRPSEAAEASAQGRYKLIPIQINAMAGTHELGKFMVRLESSATFFRITSLKIMEHATDLKRHSIELYLDTYAR